MAPLGLRTRLIAAFLLVAAISAVSTAALTYRQARSAILTQSQDTAVSTLREALEAMEVSLPVDQPQLQHIANEMGKRGKPHPGRSSPNTAACGPTPGVPPPPRPSSPTSSGSR